jgi:hypothetical protein
MMFGHDKRPFIEWPFIILHAKSCLIHRLGMDFLADGLAGSEVNLTQ